MERYGEIIGKPVICVENGRKIGTVNDLIFDPKNREVKALLLESKGYEIRKKVILLGDVLSMGRDAVVISSSECVKSLKKMENSGGLGNRGNVRGLRIYSKSGQDFGVVQDVLFDEKTGLIEGVEISDGLLEDIFKGRRLLPLVGRVEFSEENILVEKEAIEEITGTGGGLKGRLMERQDETRFSTGKNLQSNRKP